MKEPADSSHHVSFLLSVLCVIMECRWADGSNSLLCGDYNTAVYWELSACRSDRLCCFLSETKCFDNHHSLSNMSTYKPVTCVLNTAQHDHAESSLLLRMVLLEIACVMLHCCLRECDIPGPVTGTVIQTVALQGSIQPSKIMSCSSYIWMSHTTESGFLLSK